MKASDTASPQGNMHRKEVIIVGAGQAGLSLGYWLKRQPHSFLLLEAGPRIGESWRQRYDSLVLFTPRRYSALPGLAFPGDPAGRPTKDEMADYLHTYADHFALPIQMDTRVVDMQKRAETFVLHTIQGTYQAATVIVATGPFHHPRIPAFASALSPQVEQLHSAAYRNPSAPPGSRWHEETGGVAQSATGTGVGTGTEAGAERSAGPDPTTCDFRTGQRGAVCRWKSDPGAHGDLGDGLSAGLFLDTHTRSSRRV
jgi:glycine/D-amino acid oxidase-like deaminating enzyme